MAFSTCSATLSINTNANVTETTSNLSTLVRNPTHNISRTLSLGAGDLAINEIYQGYRTLTAGSNETLDLYGSLTNILKDTVNFARIKMILIEVVTDLATTSLSVEPGATHPFTGPFKNSSSGITLGRKGGVCFWQTDATGWAVTNSSSDKIKVTNNDGAASVDYKISIWGALT